MREFKKLGYGVRWRLSPCFLLLAFGESVRAMSFAYKVVEAKLWVYACMVHLANSIVGRAPGIKV